MTTVEVLVFVDRNKLVEVSWHCDSEFKHVISAKTPEKIQALAEVFPEIKEPIDAACAMQAASCDTVNPTGRITRKIDVYDLNPLIQFRKQSRVAPRQARALD